MAIGELQKRYKRETEKYGIVQLNRSELESLIYEVRNRTKEEIEKNFKVKWHLVKDEMPRDGKPVWFYPPLIGYRSGRWNSYNSAIGKLAGTPKSEREEDHWSPEFGNDFLGRKKDLIAWAYMDDDFLPSPNLKIELEGE